MLREGFDDLQSVGWSIMAATKRPVVKRTDPKPGPIDPIEGMSRVLEADPAMRYVWAPLHGDLIDVNYYESLGYTKVILEEGGPRPVRVDKSKMGQAIVQFGSVLMQMPREQYREEIYGPGQDKMTHLEKRIYDKEMARKEIAEVEGISGLMGEELIDAVNTTSPLTRGY